MKRIILLHKEIQSMNTQKQTSNMNEITDEQFASIRQGTVSITQALCFALGWQGGTLHQVAAALQVTTSDILNADDVKQGDLLRKAQKVYWQSHKGTGSELLFKHLKICVEALKRDYLGHMPPPWLERAEGVMRIFGEVLSS